MGAIQVYNLTKQSQWFGNTELPARKWTGVPYSLAVKLAEMPEYRCDDTALIGDYKYIGEEGTYLGWSSPLHYADGYGSVAQEIARTFLRMGVALSIFPRDYMPSHPNFGGLPLDKWEQEAFVPGNIVERLHQSQDRCFYGFNMTWPKEVHKHPFARGIGYTMFETTLPPREWAECMNMCRAIAVPCKQNEQAFRDIGVTVPIYVSQLGVNVDDWRYVERDAENPFGFNFLMAAGLTMRKNPIGAARAFVDAFPNTYKYKDISLILKTRGDGTSAGFREWEKYLPSDPRIRVVCEESTPIQMKTWFYNADCYVYPSHGEGFGMTPLQAMATGCPTIVSDNSGMSEYCDKRYCWPIPCKEVKVPHASAGGFPEDWGDVGNWWVPDHEALVESMRLVYENREKAYKKGAKAAKWVRENWTVEHTCRKLLDVVRRDYEGE